MHATSSRPVRFARTFVDAATIAPFFAGLLTLRRERQHLIGALRPVTPERDLPVREAA